MDYRSLSSVVRVALWRIILSNRICDCNVVMCNVLNVLHKNVLFIQMNKFKSPPLLPWLLPGDWLLVAGVSAAAATLLTIHSDYSIPFTFVSEFLTRCRCYNSGWSYYYQKCLKIIPPDQSYCVLAVTSSSVYSYNSRHSLERMLSP